MNSSRPQLSRQEVGHPRGRHETWCGESIRSTAEIGQVIQTVTAAMAVERYPEKDIFGMHLALEEAIVNAIKHGHNGDERKRVRVRYVVNAQCVLAEIEDQGPGFDPVQVPDPLAPENLELPRGRGLLLMRHYMTEVYFNKRGNRVTLCKCRSVHRRDTKPSFNGRRTGKRTNGEVHRVSAWKRGTLRAARV